VPVSLPVGKKIYAVLKPHSRFWKTKSVIPLHGFAKHFPESAKFPDLQYFNQPAKKSAHAVFPKSGVPHLLISNLNFVCPMQMWKHSISYQSSLANPTAHTSSNASDIPPHYFVRITQMQWHKMHNPESFIGV